MIMFKFKAGSCKGSTLMIFIILLMFFILAATLAIDFAMVSISKSKLSAAVDAGTLAGAQTMIQDLNNGAIDEDHVKSVVTDYIKNKNTRNIKSDPIITINTTEMSIKVDAVVNEDLYFANVFSIPNVDVNCVAKAIIGPAANIKNLRPFSITVDEYNDYLADGGEVTIKTSGSGGDGGNFKLIDLDGDVSGGANDIKKWVENGYDGVIKPGDQLVTETGSIGNTISKVKDLLDANGGKVTILIPIILFNNLPAKLTGNEPVTVEGYAPIELCYGSFAKGKSKKPTPPGNSDIVGTFVKDYTQGELDNTLKDYGVYTMELVE